MKDTSIKVKKRKIPLKIKNKDKELNLKGLKRKDTSKKVYK